jgi:MoxR-like ATPase
VKSRSTSGASWCLWINGDFLIPHGSSEKITYHVGVLGLLRALQHQAAAIDLLESYLTLLEKFGALGWSSDLLPELVNAADELYYFLRFAGESIVDENDLLLTSGVTTPEGKRSLADTWDFISWSPLTNSDELRRLLKSENAETISPSETIHVPTPAESKALIRKGFVGPQAVILAEACEAAENILLAGPTGSGKTFCFQQVAQDLNAVVVSIEGKEGLLDLDFLGAIVPRKDGSRVWVDGPLSRAIRLAWEDRVLLFIDEINRIPQKQVNMLLTVMNPKAGVFCRQLGIEVDQRRNFYVLEIPMTSEVLACPAENLQIIIAGNFGRSYSVYNLDPALRRRFETVIEFDYLAASQEIELLQERVPELPAKVVQALVNVAQETRRMLANGELPGCVDTGSLIHWALKCSRHSAQSISEIMRDAQITWADLVCGRDHMGRINIGNFKALEDYLKSLGILSG